MSKVKIHNIYYISVSSVDVFVSNLFRVDEKRNGNFQIVISLL